MASKRSKAGMGRTSRRAFLKGSSATVLGAAGVGTAGLSACVGPGRGSSPGEGARTLRIALIGCGGRGTGAAAQALSTSGSVELVAMADAFSDRLESSLASLKEIHPEQVKVPEGSRFSGFDAFKSAMTEDVDVVVLATPPGFRPMHFEHAVSLGKHVFMEKPVAVDAPGVRTVLAAAEAAVMKGLKVGVGLQRHHDPLYQDTVARIQGGAIGRVQLLRCYWNGAGVWVRARKEGMGEMEYQMRNWYYFNWLCGDHINEQHIHNLDVCNWIMDGYPVEAQGQGGRQVRTGLDHGEIFDHHMVEYTYADGTKMISQCRHMPGCENSISEHVHGTLGTANVTAGRIQLNGGDVQGFEGEKVNPYQVEHDRLFEAIRTGRGYMEAKYGARSTMTAIMGRMATYSGRKITWDQALNSEIALVPSAYDWSGTPPSVPDVDGRYPIPVPGSTQVV